ncbi:TIGR02444 family protein [Pseudaminobacter arsenicus]|uniref:TIGR02444 family protein n=1 Tax=Borborobacter arsenicus TaxID=1851146 RepID=A0A432V352_9HYPH|nr:TIGR02444 family protein [Pseudaminobacter arsenicus]RUM96634.1 TIGR02444 family protein [Pseudaminobacter arsenicus]
MDRRGRVEQTGGRGDRKPIDDLVESGPHWAYSLSLYRKEGVPAACLLLQDTYGVDVNILLLGLYCAARLDIGLTGTDIALLDEEIREFRECVVLPLRVSRRRLKDMPLGVSGETIRNKIKEIELRAEQLEQAIIMKWLDDAKPVSSAPNIAATAKIIVDHFARKIGKTDAFRLDRRAAEAISLMVSAAA